MKPSLENQLKLNAEPRIKVAVIPAAGKGTRAYPRTTFIPKPLLQVEEASLLVHNIQLLHKKFEVQKVYVIVGHLKEQIIEELEKLKATNPGYEIIAVPWTTNGLASDIASLQANINEPFVITLGDEFYQGTNHEKFLEVYTAHPEMIASIGVIQNAPLNQIKKNYSVELGPDNLVTELVEKPSTPKNHLLGVGSYLCTNAYFEYFKKTPPSKRTGIVEFTDVLDLMAKDSKKVYATLLDGKYFQVNSLQDYHHGMYEFRNLQFEKYRVSLVMASHNNERTLSDVLTDFKSKTNEIVVVDSGSKDNTRKVTHAHDVKLEHFISAEAKDAEGLAVRHGFATSKGDILVLTSAKGEFRAKDIPKLLEYIKDSDMVIGTRTTRQMIEQASNMRPILRMIHLFLGKLIELFWWSEEPRITDTDCQFLAIWKDAYLKIQPQLKVEGKGYIAEMHMEILRAHMRCIEIPVSYYKSDSSKQYSLLECFQEGWTVFKLILSKKFQFQEEK